MIPNDVNLQSLLGIEALSTVFARKRLAPNLVRRPGPIILGLGLEGPKGLAILSDRCQTILAADGLNVLALARFGSDGRRTPFEPLTTGPNVIP